MLTSAAHRCSLLCNQDYFVAICCKAVRGRAEPVGSSQACLEAAAPTVLRNTPVKDTDCEQQHCAAHQPACHAGGAATYALVSS